MSRNTTNGSGRKGENLKGNIKVGEHKRLEVNGGNT